MPDLAEQIRTVIDAGSSPISADEVIYRASHDRSLTPRRRVVGLGRGPAVAWAGVVAVAVAALLVGVGFATLPGTTRPGGSAPPTPFITRSFAVGVDRVTFTYPSAWYARRYLEDQTSFSQAVVIVASQRLHDPCTISHSTLTGRVESKVCLNYAVGRLAPNAVYLEWSYGFDGGSPGHYGQKVKNLGSPITVGGQPSTINVQKPGACASIGGDESIDVYVGSGSSGWLMRACAKSTDLQHSYSEVLAVLKSTHFSPASVSP